MASTHSGVVVGADGSPQAQFAVEWAAREAVLHGVPLTLVHVQPGAQTWTWYEVAHSTELAQMAEQRGREILRQAKNAATRTTADAGPLTISERTVEGNAVSALTDLSKDAEMVVVGSRGMGTAGRALLGSVSAGVLHHAHCPVAVIHGAQTPAPQASEAPVVVGVDGSPASERALAIAFDEASRRATGLVAVHACSAPAIYVFPSVEWTTFRPQAEEVLAERLAGWLAGPLPRRGGAQGGRAWPPRPSVARRGGIGAVGRRRQPRPWRIRWNAAGLCEFRGGAGRRDARDRRAATLTDVRPGSV